MRQSIAAGASTRVVPVATIVTVVTTVAVVTLTTSLAAAGAASAPHRLRRFRHVRLVGRSLKPRGSQRRGHQHAGERRVLRWAPPAAARRARDGDTRAARDAGVGRVRRAACLCCRLRLRARDAAGQRHLCGARGPRCRGGSGGGGPPQERTLRRRPQQPAATTAADVGPRGPRGIGVRGAADGGARIGRLGRGGLL